MQTIGNANPFGDQPPEYSTVAGSSTQASSSTHHQAPSHIPSKKSGLELDELATPEDPYAFLYSFDTVFVIDDSWSMLFPESRWHDARHVLKAITEICVDHDEDGIDVHFLNTKHHHTHSNIKQPRILDDIFKSAKPPHNRYTTHTGRALRKIWDAYEPGLKANMKKTKPMNVIVITDGEPSDDPEPEIIRIAKALDKLDAPSYQFGIQFIQVGDDAKATKHLTELDDELKEQGGGCRDIVDTTPYKQGQEFTSDMILKAVLGGVHKRYDRKKN